MSLGDFIVLILVAAGAGFALRSALKHRGEEGGCPGCSGCSSCPSCSSCPGEKREEDPSEEKKS